jgi:hypothetical protein
MNGTTIETMTRHQAIAKATRLSFTRGFRVRFGTEGSVFVIDPNGRCARQYAHQTKNVWSEEFDNLGTVIPEEIFKAISPAEPEVDEESEEE